MTARSSTMIGPLIRCNQAILNQKLSLLSKLESKHGFEKLAHSLFTLKCPIVKASIGQHYRHSMDHMELAILVATTRNEMINQNLQMSPCTIQYDQRVRGGPLENDVNEAKKRIHSLLNILEELKIFNDKNGIVSEENVYASFMLSSDPKDPEIQLKSTIGRELGFTAHHAIHHLAMVRVIVLQTLGLDETELPDDFGKAPSTIRFENKELPM